MPRRMLRWQVPVDDEWHEFPIVNKIVMAETVYEPVSVLDSFHVDVWAEKSPYPGGVELRVFGTGYEIPEGAQHVVSAPRHSSGLVFHVYRK